MPSLVLGKYCGFIQRKNCDAISPNGRVLHGTPRYYRHRHINSPCLSGNFAYPSRLGDDFFIKRLFPQGRCGTVLLSVVMHKDRNVGVIVYAARKWLVSRSSCINGIDSSPVALGLFRTPNMKFKYEIGDYYFLNNDLYEVLKAQIRSSSEETTIQ